MAAQTGDRGKYVKGILFLVLGIVLTVVLLGAAVRGLVSVAGRFAHVDYGVNKAVTIADVGLPAYPGAVPFKEDADDDSAVNLWASAGGLGGGIAVLGFASPDSPADVAAFYRKALAQYGQVVNCSDKTEVSDLAADLCDSDRPDPGTIELKAGRESAQHVVAIKPAEGAAGGSQFTLIYIRLKGFSL